VALIGPCLVLYALSHTFSFSGFAYVVTFLVLFLLTRAVLIPSTALHTFVLSIPAPIGVFLIQLWYGQSFAFPGEPYRHSHFIDTLIQNQVCLLGAVAVAMVASRVNLTLRRRNFDARHVGQYEIHEPIGTGAMGEVFLATHSLLKRKTALKFLRPEIAGRESLERFEQEVRLSSRLTHPNNISIYDYGYTAEGVFYYAMELLTGANLREIVERTGPMPTERAIHVLVQACGALKEAHEKAILHRDIKATNIMLCEQGGELDVVKILDFGLAKRLDSRSGLVHADGTVAGSIETLAPEALLGKDLGAQSDLYSLSVVAYHLVTGRPLFEASTAQDMIRHHLESKPVPASQANPAVPSDLESVILQGLNKEPGRRPPDAEAFRHRLLGCSEAGKWDQDKAHAWWEQYGVIERHTVPETEISTSSIETRVRPEISDRSVETRIHADGFRDKKALE
jgi:serine/threonine-protein kinase